MQLGHVQRVASIFVKITLPWLDDGGRVVSRDDGEGPCSEARKVDSGVLRLISPTRQRTDPMQAWFGRAGEGVVTRWGAASVVPPRLHR